MFAGAFFGGGVLQIRWLLPRHRPLNRVWMGLCLGLLELMWLSALAAFALSFGMAAHACALAAMILLTVGAYFARDRHTAKAWDAEETRQLRQALLFVLPLTVFSAYLQYTHTIRVAADGSYHVGQSTYGDLAMHLSFITSLKNAKFPPEYAIFPGQRLSYPFLADSLSTTFYLMGWSLQMSVIVPGTLMMALCYLGVLLLAREMTLGKKTILLAATLFFLNGGLGFLYDFDQAAGFESDGSLTVLARLKNILEGYYKTPTNQPEPNNLRWSNLIADLLVPQRTLLGGYCMVIPCFYLLYTAFDPRKRAELGGGRAVALLGAWGGALPLIHTHSFLALGLCSAGMMLYDAFHDPERAKQMKRYLLYGGIAVVLAATQLICFTFRQALTGTGVGGSFLKLQFNWVNNPRGAGMRDFYLWFYIKNIGLPFIALLCALTEKDSRTRRIAAGAFAIFIAAELVRFQPNEYDNNKLFYLWYLLCAMLVSDWLAKVWRRLKGLRGRWVLAGFTAVCLFLSPVLTLWREAVSDYQAFSAGAVEAGEYVRDNTPEHSVFMTGTQHLNPVSSLAGRTIICGPDLWLYYHGINTEERKAEIAAFYTSPEENAEVLQKYDVSYIYVSSYERGSYDVDEEALERLYIKVFENMECTIYQVPEG